MRPITTLKEVGPNINRFDHSALRIPARPRGYLAPLPCLPASRSEPTAEKAAPNTPSKGKAAASGVSKRSSQPRSKPGSGSTQTVKQKAGHPRAGNTAGGAKSAAGKATAEAGKDGAAAKAATDTVAAVKKKKRRPKAKKSTPPSDVEDARPQQQIQSSQAAPVRTATITVSMSSLLSSSGQTPAPTTSTSTSKLSTSNLAYDDDDSDDDDEYFLNDVPGSLSNRYTGAGSTQLMQPSTSRSMDGSPDWSAMDLRVANLAPKRKSIHQRFAVRACPKDCSGSQQLNGWCGFEVKINFTNLVQMFEVLPDLLSSTRISEGVLSLTLPGDYLVYILEREEAVDAALQQLQALMMDPLLALDMRWVKPEQDDDHRHQAIALLTLATPRRCVIIRISTFKTRNQLPASLQRLLTSPDVRLLALDWTHEHELRMQAQFGLGKADLPGLLLLKNITNWFGYHTDATLRDLLSCVLGVEVNKKIAKKMAQSNWETPNLSSAQVKNVALDTLGVGAIFRQLRFVHSMRFRCPWCQQRSDEAAPSDQRYRCQHPGCMCSFTSFDDYDQHCTSTTHASTHVRITCYWCGRSVVLLKDNIWQVVPMQNPLDALAASRTNTEVSSTSEPGVAPQQPIASSQKRSVLFSIGLVEDTKTTPMPATLESSPLPNSKSGVEVRFASLLGRTEDVVTSSSPRVNTEKSKPSGRKLVVAKSSLLSTAQPLPATDSQEVGDSETGQGSHQQVIVKARVSLLAND